MTFVCVAMFGLGMVFIFSAVTDTTMGATLVAFKQGNYAPAVAGKPSPAKPRGEMPTLSTGTTFGTTL